jgi:rubrerythrin
MVYQNATKNSSDPDVQNFFENRVNEEKKHYNYLLGLYQAIIKYKELKPVIMEKTMNQIFSDDFKKRIGNNHLLFSAISVATLLEKNAMDFYKNTANETDDEILKSFFKKMAYWEQHHYDVLVEIAEEAKENFWQENRFEPF